MLQLFNGRSSTDCTRQSRREFLRVGALSALGLSLPAFLRMKQAAAAGASLPEMQTGVADQLAPQYEAGMSKYTLGQYRDRIDVNIEAVYQKVVRKE